MTTHGSYAFLEDPADTASAVSTYEALRDGTTTALRMTSTGVDDARRGTALRSQGADRYRSSLYPSRPDDLFEWRQADRRLLRDGTTTVRYETVTESRAPPSCRTPRGRLAPETVLGVEWMTFTYTGCSGAISASDNAQIVWGSLPNLGGESLSAL